MAFVVDASVTMSWCFADETTPFTHNVLDALRRSYAEVPVLWLLEVKNVLLINERRGRVTVQGPQKFLESLFLRNIHSKFIEPSINERVLFPSTTT